MTIHICAPAPDDVQLIRGHCPTCGSSRRLTAQHYEWYGWSVTGLRCGEGWSDGERLARPFERGWRKKSVRTAWKTYTRARSHLSSTPAAGGAVGAHALP